MKAILTAIVSGTSLLALASAAQAQGAAPATGSTTVPAPSPGAAQPVPPAQPETTPDAATVSDAVPEEAASDIVVTGSRIVRDGSRSPTPVTVLSTAQLVTSNPTSLSDALRDIPQLAGTSGVASGGTTSSSAQTVGLASGSYSDLRRLGPARTLVLQDGVRLPPNRPEGLVDTNLVPQLLIDRVEIVTGGASAVYGSDAVAGVINFITNNRYRGIQGVVQGGITSRSDAENYRVGIAAGTALLDGRLHVVGSVEHSKNTGVDSICDRPLGCLQGTFGGQNGAAAFGTATNPYIFYTGVGRSNLSFGGKVTVGPAGLAGRNFDANGNLVPVVAGTAIGNGYCIDCDGSNNDAARTTLIPRIQTTQSYGHVEYDITDAATIFGQVTYARSTTSDFATIQANQGNIRIFNGNAFLPAAAQAALTTAGPASSFTLGKQWLSLPHVEHDISARTLNFIGGLRGKIADRFSWDVTLTNGTSRTTTRGTELNAQKAYAALDAVRAPDGRIVCRVTLTNPMVMPGCAPLNPFGNFTASPEAIAFAQDSYRYYQEITQKSVAANLSGRLLSWWAGDVSASVGAEYRRVSLDATGNQKAMDITGVRQGATTTTFFANNIFPTRGEVAVKEVYGEAIVPLVRDVPAIRSLELSIAGRHTNYSTSGGVNTWKVGGVWDVVDGLRFRATRSRDIRAPALFDLFAPTTISLVGFTDRLTGINQAVTVQGGGNPNLVPEKADTLVIGTVVTPRFAPGLTLSVDWYRIALDGAIAQPFSLQEIGNRCFDSGGTDILCNSIDRPFPYSNTSAANFPTRILVQQINISKQQREGLDIEAGYTTSLGAGRFSVRGIGNIQYRNRSYVSPTAAPIEFAGTDFSKFRGNLLLNYDISDWSFFVRERLIGGRRQDRTAVFVEPKLPSAWYTDANISKTLAIGGRKVEAFLNVTNLFNELPPVALSADAAFFVPGQRYPSDLNMYDVLGRRYVAGLRFKL